MIYAVAFLVLSIPIVLLSWKSLKDRTSHGFYRFFSWEAILVLLIFNIEFWFTELYSLHQIFSWILLLISIWLVLTGTTALKKYGKQKQSRNEENLYAFEKTSELVQTGIYKFIRHPLYSSLLFLAWGTFLKRPDWILLHVAVFSSFFLYLTARADEKECIDYFGDNYRNYMKKTKRFIPFIF